MNRSAPQDILHLDFETRSVIDLKLAGAHVYAADPSTDILCACYAFNDEPVQVWLPGRPLSNRLAAHLADGGEIRAWNATFERLIIADVATKRYGWPVAALKQFRCVMARSFALSLPGGLEDAGAAVGLEIQKDMEGYRLMLAMCRPQGRKPDGTWVWREDEASIARLVEYCKTDVEVERQLDNKLLHLSAFEQDVYALDQVINDRGVYIDRRLAQAMENCVEQAQGYCDQQISELTRGAVTTVNSHAALVGWLKTRRLEVEDIRKDTVVELLERIDLDETTEAVLKLRQDGAKTSTAKIRRILATSVSDGYMRANLQYHAAGTSRWGGRGAQLQNLPRPTKFDEIVPQAIRALLGGATADDLEIIFGAPMGVLSECIRGLIIAPPGQNIYAGDFSAIEARMLAWLAGQESKLNVFRKGEDPYCHAASDIYGRPINKKDHPQERQIGKVGDLSLGYEGGVGAFGQMARNYGVKLDPIFPLVWGSTTEEERERVEYAWKSRGAMYKHRMTQNAFFAGETIKLRWRGANPQIVLFWHLLEDAAKEAIRWPGKVVRLADVLPDDERMTANRDIAFSVRGSFLFMQLPSRKHAIAYPYPKLEERPMPWKDENGKAVMKETICYKGPHPITGKWGELTAYGGMLANNVTQGAARDTMVEAMLRVEAAGYGVRLTVHDELITYRAGGDLAEFTDLMEVVPPWLAGCPIKAGCWTGKRYRKD